MARRISNIPVEDQIRGVKKGIRNPKTPPALRKGLQKRLKQLEAMV